MTANTSLRAFLGILARRFSTALLLFEKFLDLEVTVQGRRPAPVERTSTHRECDYIAQIRIILDVAQALAAPVVMVFLFSANDQHTFGARRREESLVLQREINHQFGHSTHQHQDKNGKPQNKTSNAPES